MRESYNQGCYNKEFLQPVVLERGAFTARGVTIMGSYTQGVLQPGVLTTRVSDHQGSFNQGSYR